MANNLQEGCIYVHQVFSNPDHILNAVKRLDRVPMGEGLPEDMQNNTNLQEGGEMEPAAMWKLIIPKSLKNQ